MRKIIVEQKGSILTFTLLPGFCCRAYSKIQDICKIDLANANLNDDEIREVVDYINCKKTEIEKKLCWHRDLIFKKIKLAKKLLEVLSIEKDSIKIKEIYDEALALESHKLDTTCFGLCRRSYPAGEFGNLICRIYQNYDKSFKSAYLDDIEAGNSSYINTQYSGGYG